MSHDKLTVGSLFAGIGGIEHGIEKTGIFETRWFVENNLYCQFILRKHWPNCQIYGDITTIDWNALEKVDVITGGFPCQDISVAGRRKGIKEGTRSGLWFYFKEAIRILRPKYVIIENVSAITRNGLDIVLSNLAEIGYDAEWYDIRASDVGAPHKRERIFIIAYPNSPRFDSQRHGEVQGPSSLSEERQTQTPSQWQERVNEAGKPSADVSNPSSNGCETGSTFRGEISEEIRRSELNKRDFTQTKKLSNTISEGLEGPKWEKRIAAGCPGSIEQHDWTTEPNVGRVAYGIPFRVDRIRCLGNAVVPQCAQIIGEIIKEKEK